MDGYEIPIHHALTEQIMLGGVPREIATLNGTLAAVLLLGLHSWHPIPICIIIHVVAVFSAKRDPQFFECFKCHVKQKHYYSE